MRANARVQRTISTPLLDIEQAAARLGVTTRFIRRLVEQRRVPFYKVGKFVRFDAADLDEFVNRSRVDPTEP